LIALAVDVLGIAHPVAEGGAPALRGVREQFLELPLPFD